MNKRYVTKTQKDKWSKTNYSRTTISISITQYNIQKCHKRGQKLYGKRRAAILLIKPTRCTNFSNLFLE